MSKVRKFVSLCLCFILLFSFFNSLDTKVSAITTNEIQQKLQTKMTTTGYKPGYAPPSSYTKGSGCYGFVDMLCRYLYNHGLPSQASNHYQFTGYSTNFTQIGSTLTISAGTLTESSLQTLFSQAKPGDVIQMDYTKYGGGDSLHTMMVYSVSSSGIVFYHAGSSKVYFGASSGTQPLWGTTGNVLTWAKLKAVLKSSDDGISLYRSKTVTSHTHSYTQYAESAHPHKTYKKCSCGDTYYTGATENRWLGSSYEAVHPHKVYRTCSCGYTEYTGNYQTIGSCNNCIDNSFVSSMEYNGHTYALYNINTTWENAKTFCESKGGYLATITSKSEWENVKDFNGNRCTWLGGYLDSSSVWHWVTNEHFVFTSWYPGEPNNANNNEKYIGIYADVEWNDFPNNSEVVCYFICEYGSIEINHSYSNSCDATCNICGAGRAINHTYSNDCDSSCNICGFSRIPSWHVYTNACDSTCNECGIRRIVSNHNYDDCFGYEQQLYGSWNINVTRTGVYTLKPNANYTGEYSIHNISVFDKQGKEVKYYEKLGGFPLVIGQTYTVKFRYDCSDEISGTITWNLNQKSDTIFADTLTAEQGGWYNDAVTYSVGAGLITGYGGTDLFGTADNIQRQDFVVILARLAGVDLENYQSSGEFSFADVPSGAYYEKAILWAADCGITTGYSDGTNRFGVCDNITREQLVTFLYRYAKVLNGGVTPTVSTDAEQKAQNYADYNGVTDYAQEAVIWALDKGVIKGQGGTHIAPSGNALRCEIAQIMYNIFLNDIFN